MTNRRYDLTRRKMLAGLGAVGLASAGAGLGTTAYFSDTESFLNNRLEAGTLDLSLDYRSTYSPWDRATPFATLSSEQSGEYPDEDDVIPETMKYVLGQIPDLRADGRPVGEQAWGDATRAITCEDDDPLAAQLLNGENGVLVDLTDIKPKDEGEVTMSLHNCGNPAYLWMRTLRELDEDNGQNEPEMDADPTDGPGELDDYMHVEAWYDTDCDNRKDAAAKIDIVLAIDTSGSMLYPRFGGLIDDPNGDTPSNANNNGLRSPTPPTPGFADDDTYKIDIVEAVVKDFLDILFDGATIDAAVGVVFFGHADETAGIALTDDAPDGSQRAGTRVGSFLTTNKADLTDGGTSKPLDFLRKEVSGTNKTGTDLPNGVTLGGAVADGDPVDSDFVSDYAAGVTGIEARPDAEKLLIVLGDGGQQQSSGDAVSRADTVKADGTRIVSIAFGPDADDVLLESISSGADGDLTDPFDDFYDVQAGEEPLREELREAFRQIALDITGDACFYKGSLAGFLDKYGTGVPLDPLAAIKDEPDLAQCVDPGVNCIALRWYLPCAFDEYTRLPSDIITGHGQYDGTLAGELLDKGLGIDNEAINAVQSDAVGFGIAYGAIQCRHNPTNNASPFPGEVAEQ